jgi:hypothetical protein
MGLKRSQSNTAILIKMALRQKHGHPQQGVATAARFLPDHLGNCVISNVSGVLG